MISLPRMSLRASLGVGAALITAAVAAVLATPRLVAVAAPANLEQTVPRQFGDWKEKPNPYVPVSLATGNGPDLTQPYDQVVMRTYVDSRGQMVMLALAWGARQRQEVKVHRPDLCYVAQGHRINSLGTIDFPHIAGAAGPVTGKRMVAMSSRGGEAVSYWMRIGSLYSEDAVDTRLHILKEGLAGRIPDGILVRASSPISDPADANAAHAQVEAFLTQLLAAVPAATRALLVR